MPFFGIMLGALLVAWYVGVTVALVLLWLRTKPEAFERQLSGLRLQLQKLLTRVEELQAEVARIKSATERLTAVSRPSPPTEEPAARPVEAEPSPQEVAGFPTPPQKGPVTVPPSIPEPRPRPAAQPPAPAPKPKRTSPEIEALIGGNWLLKIGILAVVLGALYFLKYAFDNRWIGDTGRVLIGVFSGIGMLYSGELFQKKGYPLYGQSLSAGGVSILYLSIYAAFNFYSLIGQLPALVFMALVTSVTCLLSARYFSKTLAVMGLLGGVLTPYWLSTGKSNQVGLLSYLFILDAGMGLLARARSWHFLNVLSLIGTVLLFAGWANRYYTRDALWTTQVYLVLFAALYVYFFEEMRATKEKEGEPNADLGRILAAVVVVGFFFSSQGVLGHSALYYWVFLLCFDALFLGISLRIERTGLAAGIFTLNALGIWAWTGSHYRDREQMLVWGLLTLIFVLFLGQGFLRRRLASSPADNSEVLVAIGTGLGYFGLSYYLLRQSWQGWMGSFALALAVLYLVAARSMFRMPPASRAVALAYVGVSISLVTLAIPIQLEQNWITVAWAAEAVVLAWIGFSTGSVRLRQASMLVLALSLLRLFGEDVSRVLPQYRLVFNPRFFTFLFVISAIYLLSLLYRRHVTAWVEWEKSIRTALILLASGLSVFLISLEAWAYHGEQLRGLALRREELLVEQYSQSVSRLTNSRQLVLSLLWGIYSITVVTAGIARRYRPLRLFGIALFFLAIAKVFAVDIWTLEKLYRILSVIALGCLLLAVAFLYQRFKKLLFDTEAGTG